MTRHTFTLAAGLALAAVFVAAAGASSSPDPSAAAGFIHGTVETRSGASYTGVLRWGTEEAFWDDIFHSFKEDLPYADYADQEEKEYDTWWERMAGTIGEEVGAHRQVRVLAIRFGDISELRVTGSNDAVLTLKDGSELEVGGYANDAGATVTVRDAEGAEVEVPWRKIDTVTFSAAPDGFDPGVFRLRGTVATSWGELRGFVQWDSQESVSTDVLDGDEGDRRHRLEMGEIRSIERRNSRSALVVLKDGAELVLSGTNDVNDDIRGIHIEDPRFGRVEVPWDEFDRVVFDDPGPSGRSYDEFPAAARLTGKVTTRDGGWARGRLVFDLDEEWGWEMLDGEARELDYSIPFALVASIEPRGGTGSLVRLRTGEELVLDNSHDVDTDNDGVVVIPDGDSLPTHLPWKDIERIDFD
jgi:hypothetical protein